MTDLPTMRITDTHGIGLDVKAIDIDLTADNTVRLWLTPEGGLRIETHDGKRIRLEVRNHASLTLTTENT